MTEACSGRQGDLGGVEWYVATGSSSISNGVQRDLAGYYSPASNRIVLADTSNLEGSEIRHEMLHALLGPSVSGHPRSEFLGRCAGTVLCIESCITDGGPPPPNPAAVTVGPEALRVTALVNPAVPMRAVDDGWFTFTILVTNPRATAVAVTLAPPGDDGPPVSFSWSATCLRALGSCGNLGGNLGGEFRDERADDMASVTRFASGETKRFVVDFQVGRRGDVFWAIAPGPCEFTGYYNGRYVGQRSVLACPVRSAFK
jgi:hypothetical protein